MSEQAKINTDENEKIKTQIDASIGIARSLIHSWLPAAKPGEESDDEQDSTLLKYSTGRPDRLGLGAKFLSHNEAMRHTSQNGMASKEALLLKNKILNGNRRAVSGHELVNTPIGKRFRPQDVDESESDNEEESRSTTVGTTKQNKKKHNNKKTKTASTTAAAATVVPTPPPQAANKKKIGNQGDFLSMYLSERAGKKKNKK